MQQMQDNEPLTDPLVSGAKSLFSAIGNAVQSAGDAVKKAVNENSNGGIPAGYKPENDLALNSGGQDNEFYYDAASKRWMRRGQEQQAAVDYNKYDYNTGRLKQEIPVDLPPPPSIHDMQARQQPPNGMQPGYVYMQMQGQQSHSGRYVDVLGSQRGY